MASSHLLSVYCYHIMFEVLWRDSGFTSRIIYDSISWSKLIGLRVNLSRGKSLFDYGFAGYFDIQLCLNLG